MSSYLHYGFPYFLPESMFKGNCLNPDDRDRVSFVRESCSHLHTCKHNPYTVHSSYSKWCTMIQKNRRDETLFNGHTCTHSDICSLHLTHPSTMSLVLGAVGSYCTVPGEHGSGGGCPVPCSRAPRQGRRWTGTSPSSSPHSIFRSGTWTGDPTAHSPSPYWLSHCRQTNV